MPSKERERAADLLGILASQGVWWFGCWTLPGFTTQTRRLANDTLAEVNRSDQNLDWMEAYAESEARLRSGVP